MLAAILSLCAAYRAAVAVREIQTWRRYVGEVDATSELVFIALIGGGLSLLLITGSIALFARRRSGRTAIAFGSAMLLLAALGALARHLVDYGLPYPEYYVFYGAMLILSLITFSTAVSRSTARWLAQRRSGRS